MTHWKKPSARYYSTPKDTCTRSLTVGTLDEILKEHYAAAVKAMMDQMSLNQWMLWERPDPLKEMAEQSARKHWKRLPKKLRKEIGRVPKN